MEKFRLNSFASILIAAAVILSSCGGGDKKEEVDGDDSTNVEDPDVKNKIEHTQNIVYSVPSPAEMANILLNAGAVYNYKLLNDIKNVDKYATTKARAINLGIYGADLNYANIFENTQETMFYIQCTQKLTEVLGIENSISESSIARAQDNVDNKDSMVNIISEMFWEMHDYLQENDKLDITAFVIAGGWVEGLYLATQTVDDKKPNMEIVQKVAELKLSLNHLISLLEGYKEEKGIEPLIADMISIRNIYDQLATTSSKTTTKVEDGTTVIGGGPNIKITMEQFLQIKAKAAKLRNDYITLN